MLHLADHAADLGAVFQLAGLVHLVQSEADQRRTLARLAPDRRTGLGHLDGRHFVYSATAAASASATSTEAPPRRSRSAIFLPRRCATERGLVCSRSASKVARIML